MMSRTPLNPPRKVPFALKDAPRKELDHMERMRIIQKVMHWCLLKTAWQASFFFNARPLNQAMKRSPTREEIISSANFMPVKATDLSGRNDGAMHTRNMASFSNCVKIMGQI